MTPVAPLARPPRRLVFAALLVALVLVACGSAVTPSAPTGSASPSPGDASPGASSSDDGSAPKPTPWPGHIVEAVMNLAKADAQIQAAGGDLAAAADSQDLKAMWGAADGLATLLERLIPEVDRIRDYPETAAAAKAYDASLPVMLAGAKQLRDAITNGDAAGITAGSEQLSTGIQAYAAARRLIGPLADQAILMQKLLVK